MNIVFYILFALLGIILANRIFIYFYFKEFKMTNRPRKRLDSNVFRNAHERSGITPGGVSWVETYSGQPYRMPYKRKRQNKLKDDVRLVLSMGKDKNN